MLQDCTTDPEVLFPLKSSFKRLLQVGRAFSLELNELASIWKPFPKRAFYKNYADLCGKEQPAYKQVRMQRARAAKCTASTALTLVMAAGNFAAEADGSGERHVGESGGGSVA